MAVALPLACAALAALSYGIGSVMQAAAVRHAENRPNLDPLLPVRLVGQLPYVAGLALDLLGFVASVIALRTLPLFVVQSAIAGSVGVTAIGASIVFGPRLLGYERAALVALMVGFVLLAVSARPERAASLGSVGQGILVCGVIVVLAAGAFSARLDNRKAGIGLAACAGLSWAGTGIAARVLQVPSSPWRLLIDPIALCLAGYGLLGMLLFATALQRGSVTAAAAIVFTIETVVPSLIGIAVLSDHARSGFLLVAVVGFVATVGGSIAVARRSEPLPREAVPSS